jgi:hypothetical protein
MSVTDVFELLAAANPMPVLEETLPGDEALLRSLLDTPLDPTAPSPPATRRRRTRFGIIGGGSAVVIVALAAFATLGRRSAEYPTMVLCYSEASAEPQGRVALGTSADPIGDCRERWESGAFGALGDGGEVPQLVGCVNDSGVIVVVPGDVTACERLAMQRWSMSFSDEQQRLMAFTDEISALFGEQCIGEADAYPTAKALLAKYGLDDWSVGTSGSFRPGRMCAVAAVDPELRTVFIATRRGPP